MEFAGACHLRFDDTNPTREEQQYVDAIIDAVRWLGFDWGPHLYFASNYFAAMHQCAVALVERGHAYVDSQSPERCAEPWHAHRAGPDSPHRSRSVAENLDLFARMKAGEFPDGAHVLRAKIDMASPNINLRDPPIYRIRHAHHHNTGRRLVHLSDVHVCAPHRGCARERHAFPVHARIRGPAPLLRLAAATARGGWLVLRRRCRSNTSSRRLNLTYTVLSKRKLMQLVDEGHVDGWDDPRLPPWPVPVAADLLPRPYAHSWREWAFRSRIP